MKQLDRLLFAQGGKCFFCAEQLDKAEASIEHLQPKSTGGTEDESNLVSCCKTLNFLFGSKTIKEKFAIVVNQPGKFQCPAKHNGS